MLDINRAESAICTAKTDRSVGIGSSAKPYPIAENAAAFHFQ